MIIKSKRVWYKEDFIPDAVKIENGRIIERLGYDVPADIDYGSRMLLPGFIDIHTHGGFGVDIMDTDEAGIKKWALRVPEFGVTSFLAATFTDSRKSTLKAIKNVVNVYKEHGKGAEILGINLEGPFIGLEYAGGMEERWIQAPDIREYDLYHDAAEGLVKICTIAPEREGAFALLDHITARGVIPSAGHTAADYDTIQKAVNHGLKNITHTFNCMTALHHRAPGCVGAAMLNDRLFCECACDGHMVSAPAAAILSKMKGREKLIFVTDALACQGMPPGVFYTSGHNTEVREDGSCVEIGTGMYMGCSLGMNAIFRIAVQEAEIELVNVVDACSLNAAVLLGMDDRKGRLLPGFDADITVLNEDYSVEQTLCRGAVCIERL